MARGIKEENDKMGFLDRMIQNGIKRGVEKAVGNAVQKAVEPKATELANKAAASLDQAAKGAEARAAEVKAEAEKASGFDGAMANLQRSAENYATAAAKNMKICSSCEEATTADKKFCPKCGTKLPEQSVADAAVCTNCGKQNSVGTTFCSECGTKLPAAIMEEEKKAKRCEEIMKQWDEMIPMYPKWACGGTDYNLEKLDTDVYMFAASFDGNRTKAMQAVEQYRQLVREHGFRPAGEYPSEDQLYNKINGICYNIDTEHCFDGDPDCPTVYFTVKEPAGGFDYVKPEPKKKTSLRDLFGF